MLRDRPLPALPDYILNGIGVALGVAAIEGGVDLLAGSPAAIAAASGAICVSLADVPLAVARTARRVAAALLFTCIVSALAGVLRPFPLALGAGVAALGFVSALMLTWGARAGPLSFVGILALVFVLARPVDAPSSLLAYLGWTSAGAALYLAWSIALSWALQSRWQRMALASALDALAALLRSQARLLTSAHAATREAADATAPLRDWIGGQSVLDERLQAARDLLFAAPESPTRSARVAMLLQALDLRDTLLASGLDLELLGQDAAAARFRDGLAANLIDLAERLDALVMQLEQGHDGASAPPCPHAEHRAPAPGASLHDLAQASGFVADHPSAALAQAALRRAQHTIDGVLRLQAGCRDGGASNPPTLALTRAELRRFVSAEGWPLAVLRAQFAQPRSSSVVRHAVRAAVALSGAYFIGLGLPWASHPHWLVLSVAVVLRGSLEQTLARRDARVAGTVIGCVLVTVLGGLAAPGLSVAVFLVAVGLAHAFVTRRYLVTAAAATVMALLQSHLLDPVGGFGAAERLADTLLGALLAWGCSYLLPSWERGQAAAMVARVLRALSALAREALRWPDAKASDVPLRLARREVFEAIGQIAAAAQRSGVEPASVRLPPHALAGLLVHGHALLAQLAAARSLLLRRAAELDEGQARPLLDATVDTIAHALCAQGAVARPARSGAMPMQPPASDATQRAELSDAELPPLLTGADAAGGSIGPPLPWLRRRLRLVTRASVRVAQAAHTLRRHADAAQSPH